MRERNDSSAQMLTAHFKIDANPRRQLPPMPIVLSQEKLSRR